MFVLYLLLIRTLHLFVLDVLFDLFLRVPLERERERDFFTTLN